MATKEKRLGFRLDVRSFEGKDGSTYIVFRTKKGAYHVFKEVEAKQAARECGVEKEGTTREMWYKLWKGSVGS
ncbi:MAG: hypothetical protein KatS3mg105_0457 [Gemmatales bacterium]|nr:MAG: hypothetical protein KatS3mg105_0457 [Gemmatales bacterium]